MSPARRGCRCRRGLTPLHSGTPRALSRFPENWELLSHKDSCSDFLPVSQNVFGLTMTPSCVTVVTCDTRNCPLVCFSPTEGL